MQNQPLCAMIKKRGSPRVFDKNKSGLPAGPAFRRNGEASMSQKTPPSRHAAGKNQKASKPARPTRYKKSVRVSMAILSAVMALVSVLMMTAGGYLVHTMNLLVHEGDVSITYVDSLPPEEGDGPATGEVMLPDDYNADEVSQISVKGNTKDVTNIMLIGSDARTLTQGGRSDTMMLLSINTRAKTIKLISFLRDTSVTIPGRDRNGDGVDDYDKLAHAYAYGGFDLMAKTYEQNFRLKIDKYILVNFVTFEKVVDAMGGVTIELTERETSQVPKAGIRREPVDSGFQRIGTKAGTYELDGYQALQYARIRKIDSDFNRTGRQRKVIEALLEKAKSMNFGTLNNILNQCLPNVLTNMSGDELIGYALNAGTYKDFTIDTSFHLPADGEYNTMPRLPNGGAVLWLKDPAEAVLELHEFIYG